jgi:hypothetical protein
MRPLSPQQQQTVSGRPLEGVVSSQLVAVVATAAPHDRSLMFRATLEGP